MEASTALTQTQPSYIREILAAASSDGVISLAGGLPAPSTLPVETMQRLLAEISSQQELFQYSATQGYPPLLNALRKKYLLTDEQDLMVCTGSQQGLDLVARAFLNPGDGVVVETPCYLGANQVFSLCQANILSVKQTEFGPDLERLESIFQNQKPKLFYAIPDFHNPSGVSWSQQTRERVAQLCMNYDVVLLEDTPYRELRFFGQTLPAVSELCPSHTIRLRSYSKTVAPGLRLGCVTGPKQYIASLNKIKQCADLYTSALLQGLLLAYLQSGELEVHLEQVRSLYQKRYQALADALDRHLPHCQHPKVEGGMFVWLTLPECDSFELAQRLLEKGVAIVPGEVFYPKNSEAECAVRLNFSNVEEAELGRAIEIFAQVLQKLICE